MPRIYRDDGWYDLITAGSMSESEFERILCQNSEIIAPDCFLRPFKLMVRGEERDGIPDLVLIDRSYRFWWIIEVERSHHDLFRHVLPQVRCFRTASYGSEVADYLYGKNPDLDRKRLGDLMLGAPPEVAVIADLWTEQWEKEIKLEQARFLSVAIFRSSLNRLTFLREGFLPSHDGSYLSECSTSEWLAARVLKVHAPATLPKNNGEDLKIVFGSSITAWKRVDTQNSCYLMPKFKMDLQPQTIYRIEKSADNALHLIERKRK